LTAVAGGAGDSVDGGDVDAAGGGDVGATGGGTGRGGSGARGDAGGETAEGEGVDLTGASVLRAVRPFGGAGSSGRAAGDSVLCHAGVAGGSMTRVVIGGR
jgi:hypothetical protein